jgi:hypothetical protein
MGYWGRIALRAVLETQGEVRWDSPVRVSVAFISPLSAFGATWLFTHQLAYGVAASFAALLALVVLTFFWKLFTVPAAVDAELRAQLTTENEKKEHAESTRRDGIIQRLSGLYVQSGAAGDQQDWELTYGFALPPADWLNMKLAGIGEGWSVVNVHGPNYQTLEVFPLQENGP